MRSLFLKIFLWFWLAMALIGLSLLAVTWTMGTEPMVPAQRGLLGQALEDNAARLVRLWESGRHAEVETFLKQVQRRTFAKSLWFDAQGTLLAGKAKVKGASELAKRAALRDDAEFEISGVDVLAARRAPGRDGKIYVLVTAMPRGLLSALRVQPATRLLRIGAMLLVTGLVCFALARYLTNPVTKLRDATRRFAGGDLAVRVAPQLGRRRDELTELARDFDAMAERIATLLTAQQRLLGDVSHELRTPLTRLNLALELARRHSGPEAEAALNRIERESAELEQLVGLLLTISRLDGQAGQPIDEVVDMAQLARDIVADAQLEAKSRRLNVRCEAPIPCPVRAPAALMRSALDNVLRNAMRFSPDGQEVSLTVFSENEKTVVTVRDHGPGVPEENLSDIFRPFFRVDNARDRESGGAGLGLSIAERAVTAQGGTVQARNAPDGGLIVEMRLPNA